MKLKDAARAVLRASLRVLRLIGRALHISLRVIGWLFMITVLTLAGLGFYAYKHFSPEETKRLASEQLSVLLRREVIIDRLVLSPYGIKVLGLRVRRGGSEPDFLDCGLAVVTVRLKPLLDKQVEIDTVRLESPQMALIRDANGHWDVTDLFESSSTARGQSGLIPQALATAQIVVSEGSLRLDDRGHHRTWTFEHLAGHLSEFSLVRGFPVQAAFVARTPIAGREVGGERVRGGRRGRSREPEPVERVGPRRALRGPAPRRAGVRNGRRARLPDPAHRSALLRVRARRRALAPPVRPRTSADPAAEPLALQGRPARRGNARHAEPARGDRRGQYVHVGRLRLRGRHADAQRRGHVQRRPSPARGPALDAVGKVRPGGQGDVARGRDRLARATAGARGRPEPARLRDDLGRQERRGRGYRRVGDRRVRAREGDRVSAAA